MLCCVGDLLEDIVVRVPTEIAHGSDTDVTIRRRRGGSAANVAVAAAALGTPVCFVGRVGSDGTGDVLVDALVRHGVVPRVQRGGRSGSIVVLVDAAGERSMLRDRGAAAALDSIDPAVLDGVSWLHVPAYSLVGEPSASAVQDIIGAAHDAGIRVSIDASSVAVIRAYGVDRFAALLRGLGPDVVFCNEDEAELLVGAPDAGLDEVSLTVVKRGSGRADAYAGAACVASEPAEVVADARDTTGAGDAFAAGYITSAMTAGAIAQHLRSGHASAASHLRELAGAPD